ncbi:hypothetical protein [uncultured Mycobacterium sp.]|uniref:hypothetical protein n=1 Tax=uncultured Mycobacterium sp. TaxID=171292 RepID=UPI0035CBF95F
MFFAEDDDGAGALLRINIDPSHHKYPLRPATTGTATRAVAAEVTTRLKIAAVPLLRLPTV